MYGSKEHCHEPVGGSRTICLAVRTMVVIIAGFVATSAGVDEAFGCC